ncbi:hypothetical protein B4135_3319 [Caldibacillus debilis]|uniref:Uncharacterized protein n=1 Tax=Caldibacillus debilis TaxID=301148 RepID=A0A150LG09_9BACI|nr:hypothetical protein B4135_3319 [Caldibacillus debilis]
MTQKAPGTGKMRRKKDGRRETMIPCGGDHCFIVPKIFPKACKKAPHPEKL